MRFLFLHLFFMLSLIACKDDPILSNNNNPDHIKYFGFTLIDTYVDDPTDHSPITNYKDEVATFTNMADILVIDPNDHILQRMMDLDQLGMKSLLHLFEIFFKIVGTNNLSGVEYGLRPDYQDRWDTFVETNQLASNGNLLAAFYIGEEPTWNGIDFEALQAATDYVKESFDDVPILLVEAYPIIDQLIIPNSVDWIGFDHYFIKDPSTDMAFQNELQLLKSKFSNEHQKLVFIMDTHYIPWAHGDSGELDIDKMNEVAHNYYELAKDESKTIALIGYHWPNGFEFPESIGARGMPPLVKEAYVKIGKEITGK